MVLTSCSKSNWWYWAKIRNCSPQFRRLRVGLDRAGYWAVLLSGPDSALQRSKNLICCIIHEARISTVWNATESVKVLLWSTQPVHLFHAPPIDWRGEKVKLLISAPEAPSLRLMGAHQFLASLSIRRSALPPVILVTASAEAGHSFRSTCTATNLNFCSSAVSNNEERFKGNLMILVMDRESR